MGIISETGRVKILSRVIIIKGNRNLRLLRCWIEVVQARSTLNKELQKGINSEHTVRERLKTRRK
jgi:hypothetical protein